MKKIYCSIIILLPIMACSGEGNDVDTGSDNESDTSGDTDTDSDFDTGTDTDTNTDTDTDTDTETDTDTDTDSATEIPDNYQYELLEPIGTVIDSRPLFDWSDSAYPDALYRWQVAENGDFENALVFEQTTLGTSQYQLTENLTPGVNYTWRVLLIDGLGNEENWGGAAWFMVSFGALTLLTPNGDTEEEQPEFDWSDNITVSNPTYSFQLSDEWTFETILEEASGLATSEYPLSDIFLKHGKYYWWRATVTDGNGATDVWSGPAMIKPKLGRVTLESPATCALLTETTPTFQWSANELATDYRLVVATDCEGKNVVVDESGITGTSYTLPAALPDSSNVNYYWTVEPTLSDGTGQVSWISMFTLDTVSTQTNVIQWTADNNPYELTEILQIADDTRLRICPGVEVNNSTIHMWGQINVNGTVDHPVIFNNSEIAPRGDSSAPAWISIRHAHFHGGCPYGGTGNAAYGGLRLEDSVMWDINYIDLWYPVLDSVFARNIFVGGGSISAGINGTIVVYVENNVFSTNNGAAIVSWAQYDTSELVVRYNSFLSTDRIAVELTPGYDSAAMNAVNNYWGTTDISIIDSMIYDETDDLECAGTIPYLPILSAPHADTPDPSDYIK